MDNLTIYNKYREVPKEAQKTIKGGRISGMTDINPMWRIKSLTEEFGICGIGWYYNVIKKWIEEADGQAAAFVDIELFVKVDGEWSMPIHGTGGSMFVAKERSGMYVSDECYKMATTDAISVACKQLGFGADIYWEGDKTKYDNQSEASTEQPIISDVEAKALENLLIRKGVDVTTAYPFGIEGMRRDIYNATVKKAKSLPNKEVLEFGA